MLGNNVSFELNLKKRSEDESLNNDLLAPFFVVLANECINQINVLQLI